MIKPVREVPHPSCGRCKDVVGPFLVIKECWVCSVCAYKEEHPEITPGVTKRKKKQAETLFDPNCYS